MKGQERILKELVNLSKRNNISDQYPDLSAATRLSHLNSNEKSNDQYPDLSLCKIPKYPIKKDYIMYQLYKCKMYIIHPFVIHG